MEESFRGKEQAWAKVVAQAWADEEFKKRLLADPNGVLRENGIEIPETIKIKISEGKEDEITLTLPPKPAESLSVEELAKRSAANWCWSVSRCF